MRWLPLGLVACTLPDFAEEWQLDRLRLLAIRAEPAEPRPGDIVTFTSLAYVPGEEEWVSVWLACIDGDTEGCSLDPALTSQLEHAEDLSDAELAALMQALRESGFVGIQPGMDLQWIVPADALEGLSEAEALEGSSGTVTVALSTEADNELTLKRIPVSLATTPNQNPDIAPLRLDDIEVEDAVAVGANLDIDLHADLPDSAETYTYVTTDGVVETRTEEPTWRWYVSGGTLANNEDLEDVSFGDGGSVSSDMTWTTPEDAGTYTLAAVVVDGRGGMGWRSLIVTVR